MTSNEPIIAGAKCKARASKMLPEKQKEMMAGIISVASFYGWI
jgi:hypothetical protein